LEWVSHTTSQGNTTGSFRRVIIITTPYSPLKLCQSCRECFWGDGIVPRCANLSLQILISKYLSYLVFAGFLAVIISLMVVYVLGVPMLGHWENFAIVLAALLFAALGAGFVISLISETDTQAVQYSMLLLLASIFFSGFFLDLRSMWEPLKILSALLPATYGIRLLQNVMLRGGTLEPYMIGGLVFLGVFAFLLSWVLLHRTMKNLRKI
jgi:ABC-2 type transport system permease protein